MKDLMITTNKRCGKSRGLYFSKNYMYKYNALSHMVNCNNCQEWSLKIETILHNKVCLIKIKHLILPLRELLDHKKKCTRCIKGDLYSWQ